MQDGIAVCVRQKTNQKAGMLDAVDVSLDRKMDNKMGKMESRLCEDGKPNEEKIWDLAAGNSQNASSPL